MFFLISNTNYIVLTNVILFLVNLLSVHIFYLSCISNRNYISNVLICITYPRDSGVRQHVNLVYHRCEDYKIGSGAVYGAASFHQLEYYKV